MHLQHGAKLHSRQIVSSSAKDSMYGPCKLMLWETMLVPAICSANNGNVCSHTDIVWPLRASGSDCRLSALQIVPASVGHMQGVAQAICNPDVCSLPGAGHKHAHQLCIYIQAAPDVPQSLCASDCVDSDEPVGDTPLQDIRRPVPAWKSSRVGCANDT